MRCSQSYRALALACLAAVAVPAAAADLSTLSGTVRDHAGRAVPDAAVSLLDARHAVVASTRTDGSGAFRFEGLSPATYLLVAEASGLGSRQAAVSAGAGAVHADIVLEAPRISEEVTVTANLGLVESVDAVSQPVNVIPAEEIALRAKSVLAQAASGEAGIHLQRTSPTIAAIFVRGLTGAKVSVFVDGQRYSTGAMRGGINTFFNLVDPESVETVEVLRGPSSAQYGSDAIGGSIQLLTRAPALSAAGQALHGSYGLSAGSADSSAGARVSATWSAETLGVRAPVRAAREHPPGGWRHRLAQRAAPVLRPRSDGRARRRPAAGHGLHAVRRAAQAELDADRHRPHRGQLPPRTAGRRPPLRPAPGGRREPRGRPAQPDAGLRVAALPAHRLRPLPIADRRLLVQRPARGARQPGRQRQRARGHHARVREDARARYPGHGKPRVRAPLAPAGRRPVPRAGHGAVLLVQPRERAPWPHAAGACPMARATAARACSRRTSWSWFRAASGSWATSAGARPRTKRARRTVPWWAAARSGSTMPPTSRA